MFLVAADDPASWFQRALQFGAVFFFVVLPIVRSIVNARKQQAAGKAGRASADEDEEDGSDDEPESERSPTPEELGRRRFEALLRGERPEQTPATPELIAAPVSRVPVTTRAADSSLEAPPAGRLVEFDTGLSPAETERDVDRRERDEEAADRSLPAELARAEERELVRQREVAAAEYAASSSQRADVEPGRASAVDPSAPPPPAPTGARERWLFPKSAASDRRAALQRAFVLQEVFARPVALREPSQRAPRSG